MPVEYTYRIKVTDRASVTIVKTGPDADNSERVKEFGTLKEKDGFRDECAREAGALHHGISPGDPACSQTIEKVGALLFESLFNEVLENDFLNFYQRSTEAGSFLHVELDIDEQALPDLAALPWEFAHLPDESEKGTLWLGADPKLTLTRRRDSWTEADPIDLPPDEVLKIALVVAAPSDLDSVDYREVEQALDQLAQAQPGRFQIVKRMASVNTECIDDLLKNEKPHLLHFIGHGEFNEQTGESGKIALIGAAGRADWLTAEEFSTLFRRWYKPGVVVLQACEGAMSSESKAFLSVASHMLQQRVPVVVAMQYKISNAAASVFAKAFYRQLAAMQPVHKAVQEGRLAIANTDRHYDLPDFATPVLFMSIRDGNLFGPPRPLTALEQAKSDFDKRRETTCKQIDILARYKKIHDLLQEIQKNLRILDGDRAARAGEDALDWVRLQESECELPPLLDEIIERLTEAEKMDLISKDAMITDLLVEAREDLEAAFGDDADQLDAGQRESSLDDGLFLLQRAASMMKRYNDMIVATARVLQLDDLAAAIEAVSACKRGQALRGRAKELDTLKDHLLALIDRHNDLQDIEEEFNHIDPTINDDLKVLAISWKKILGPRLEKLQASQGAAGPMNSLKEYCQKLEQAIKNRNRPAAQGAYLRVRGQVGRYFKNIDEELLALCGVLTEFGRTTVVTMEGAE